MQLITANNISYTINDQKLFHGLSFSLDHGSALHIQGGNGSGKSTLIRILLGISTPTKGEIKYMQPNLVLSYLGHQNAIKSYLTPLENLELIFPKAQFDNAYSWFKKLNLIGVQDETTANLSFGQQKKLALIRILANDSDVIILDEPFVGLDQATRDLLAEYLKLRVSKGASLALTSHIEPGFNCHALVLNGGAA